MDGRGRILAASGSLIAVAIDVLYVIVIDHQESEAVTTPRVLLVSTSLALAAVLASLALLARNRTAITILLSVSTFVLLAWTILGMLSIGILVAIPMVLIAASLFRELESGTALRSGVAVAVGLATLAALGVALALT